MAEGSASAANQPIVTQRQVPAGAATMPQSGTAPITDPTAPTVDENISSPTTMVLQYLKSRGYQPSSENVRRALEANSRDPGTIPGLRSDTAATEAQDQAAMAAARGGSAGGGSGAGGKPNPFANIVNPTWETTGPGGSSPVTPGGNTAPGTPGGGATGGSGVGPLGMSILAGLPAAAAMYGASKIPALGGAAGPMPNVAAGVPGVTTPQLGGSEQPLQLTDQSGGAGSAAPSDMEMALRRATEPASSPSFVSGVPPVTAAAQDIAPRGPVTPDPAVVNEGNIGSGTTSAPPVPFNSQSPRTAPAVPTTTPSPTTDIPQVTVRAPRVAAPRVGRLILR